MPIKGVSVWYYYKARDNATNAWKTGDVANHTLYIETDGANGTTLTNSPSEVDATNRPGDYKVQLTAAEMNAGTISIGGKSSTADIELIFPGPIYTTGAAFDTSGRCDVGKINGSAQIDGLDLEVWARNILCVLDQDNDVTGTTLEIKDQNGTVISTHVVTAGGTAVTRA